MGITAVLGGDPGMLAPHNSEHSNVDFELELTGSIISTREVLNAACLGQHQVAFNKERKK